MKKSRYTGTLKERWKQSHEVFKAKFTSEEWKKYCSESSRRYIKKYRDVPLTLEQKAYLKKEKALQQITKNPKHALWHRAKRRAEFAKEPVEFTITIDDFEIPERCPLLEIPIIIAYELLPNQRARDNSPSLDRIDHTRGYVPGNVAVISFKANRAKGPLSIQEMDNLAKNWGSYNKNELL